MVYKCLHGFAPEKPHITKRTLKINSMFHYRTKTITKIVLHVAIVALFIFGTVCLVTYGKQCPLEI